MKKLLGCFLGVVFIVFTATAAWSYSFTGTTNLIASYSWSSATLSWSVYDSGGLWYYEYTFTPGAEPGLSHFIIEVSQNFTDDNNLGGNFGSPDTYNATDQGSSNPGIPGNLWGIKQEDNLGSLTITSDRAPMWGDVYAKGGSDQYAYNVMFGYDPNPQFDYSTALSSLGANDWALVPDTTTSVPEPATMLLFGTGIFCLGVFGRKRFKN
jgi:hypothetical protein